MLLLLGLVVVFVLIAWHEVPSLLRDRLYGELAVFATLMLLAFVLSVLQVMGVTIPNPMRGLEMANEALLGLLGSAK